MKFDSSPFRWFVPRFISSEAKHRPLPGFMSYTRIWSISIMLLAIVSLVPLSVLTFIDYQLTQKAIQSEHVLRTVRITSNTRRTLSSYLNERLDALLFTVQEESLQALTDTDHLAQVLKNLKIGFGGFVDLGLISPEGIQLAYEGPFQLTGKDYSGQPWLQAAWEQGVHISDVFLGFREEPHISIAVRSPGDNGEPFILRGTLDFKRLAVMLESLELGEGGDAFLINGQGRLQTDSAFFGEMLSDRFLTVPPYSEHTSHFEIEVQGKDLLLSYAYIKNSPFILMIAKAESEAMKVWYELRSNQLWLFLLSIIAILAVIYIISTSMINSIYDANARQMQAMEHMEQTSRLASVGRLAAGVAHEINNPLAVISERAGLVHDMLAMGPEKRSDKKLMENIDIVLDAVDRCGKITKQLLNFSRKIDVEIEKFTIPQVVEEVLSFLEKEAGYRNIELRVRHEAGLSEVISDRGKVQQIMLNLINNAFQAMPEGGLLSISTYSNDQEEVCIDVSDNGTGIADENIKRIFEPFFTTRRKSGGTGLGLSITYGLARKLNGDILVKSKPGEGTTFTVILPTEIRQES